MGRPPATLTACVATLYRPGEARQGREYTHVPVIPRVGSLLLKTDDVGPLALIKTTRCPSTRDVVAD